MEWKTIQEFPDYSVSNEGVIKVAQTGEIRKQYNQGNYLFVLLKNEQTRKCVQRYVHRIVAQAFHPNDTPNLEVNHIDGNKTNNNANNLEWVTRSQNQLHTTRTLGKIRAHKGKPLIANWKPIGVFDKEGKIIESYMSVREASVSMGVNYDNLCKSAKHRRRLRGKYKGLYVSYL